MVLGISASRWVFLAVAIMAVYHAPATRAQTKLPTPTADNGEPPRLDYFSSIDHKLKIDLTIEDRDVTIGGIKVNTSVFHVCQNKRDGTRKCTTMDGTGTHGYAGPRLKLDQGDSLIINYKNNSHWNCMNNHTHGLIVRANGAYKDEKDKDNLINWIVTDPKDGIGDRIFEQLVTDIKKNCVPDSRAMTGHQMATGQMEKGEATDRKALLYNIRIPGKRIRGDGGTGQPDDQHPSGIAWFHPHVHGVAKQQVSAGLAGMINIGSIRDYVCLKPSKDKSKCNDKPGVIKNYPPLRHMMLKDIQINADGTVNFDQDAKFCGDPPPTETTADNFPDTSYCEGKDGYLGGYWLFSINGHMHPEWEIPAGHYEIWRIQNASANVTYDLHFWSPNSRWGNKTDSEGMPFQVLAVDGVNLNMGEGGTQFVTPPLQRRLLMMPGSRAELWSLIATRRAAQTLQRSAIPSRHLFEKTSFW